MILENKLLYFGISYTIIRLRKFTYKLDLKYCGFTQENRWSSLLDFSPLLREGARRLMK